MKKTYKSYIQIFFIIVISFSVGFFVNQNFDFSFINSSQELKNDIQINSNNFDFRYFWKVWDILSNEAYLPRDIKFEDVNYGMISGMVSTVGDKHTRFYRPLEAERLSNVLSGVIEGFGVQLVNEGEKYIIKAILKSSFADNENLEINDIILEVNDVILSEFSFYD